MNELDGIPRLTLFMVGRTPVTVGSLVGAVAIAVACFLLARLLGAALRRMRQSRTQGSGASIYIVERVLVYGLVVAGIVAAINMLGINLTSLAVFAGALGVGVGLGLQGIVKEFVSGLVIIFEGSVQVGDYIELEGGGRGEVKEVGPRATRIRNSDRVDILLPNSKLIDERVTTWTHRGGSRRVHVPFYVAQGTDKTLVRDAVLEAARKVPFTLPDEGDRKSQVWLVGFGESSLNFELLVWPELAAVKRPAAALAAYNWAIHEALCAHGIEVPFPQMDLHVRSVFDREGDEALKSLGLKQSRHVERPQAKGASDNDAVADLEAARARDIAKAVAPLDDSGGPQADMDD
jgi:small-conductance mechanosensitive channel